MSEQELRDYLRQATVSLRDANERIRTLEAERGEPVAVVSAGCRLPMGASTPEQLWRLLADGVDCVGDLPTDRGWPLDTLYDPTGATPGTSYTRNGGFLDGVADFDAEFFGISPREALALDPQQRLLLEICWEVLERAGINPRSLRGSRTGVFAGAMYQDYVARVTETPEELEGYLGLGSAASVLSGRLAYVFGFEGPAMSVDTACSSSLVAIHLACQSLRSGECDLAVAGGVTVMCTPRNIVEMSRQHALSPDGRCKSFDAAADGTGLSEGAGLVLLERLSDARRNGHPVLGLILGSAVNSDGASNGLTAPSGPAQQRVIRAALANANLTTADVDVVDGHGTGTPLGDPIEVEALQATYGLGHSPDRPLWLGSIKSNLAHGQATAGVTALIKMVLALRHHQLPANLHVNEPSPHIDWSGGAVRLLAEPRDWPAGDRPRRAAISSFGVSGTNAHLIVEEPPAPTPAPPAQPTPVLTPSAAPLLLSARTPAALRSHAERLRTTVATNPDLQPLDVARTLLGRAEFDCRAVVSGADRDQLLAGLAEVARGEAGATIRPSTGRIAFVFGGHGAQWVGMGRELLDASPVFREALTECDAAIAAHAGWSVLDVVRGHPGAPTLDRVEVVQPVLFSVMVAMARLWAACGVRPAAVLGHSQGEMAAAHVAGALSLDDAARLVVKRSLALLALSDQGVLASVTLNADLVATRLAQWPGRISMAAVNGPTSVVVSGDMDAVEEFLADCEAEGVNVRRLATIASHSGHVDRIRDDLLAAAAGLTPRPTDVAFMSTVTATTIDGAELDGEYWYSNAREPVRFADAVRQLSTEGYDVFVEMTSHPVLTTGIEQLLEATERGGVAIGSQRRNDGSPDRFVKAMAELHTAGIPVRWPAVLGDPALLADLPTYAFQRERFWLEGVAGLGDVASLGLAEAAHPLLAAGVELPGVDGADGGFLFTGGLSIERFPWLADHSVMGSVVLPGAAVLDMVLWAAREVGADVVEELVQGTPVVLPLKGVVGIQVLLSGMDGDGRRTVTVRFHDTDSGVWVVCGSGVVGSGSGVVDGDVPVGGEVLVVEGVYEVLGGLGLEYGGVFRSLCGGWRVGGDVVVEAGVEGDVAGFGVHPGLLDGVLHGLVLADGWVSGDGVMPFVWRDVRVGVGFGGGVSRVRARLVRGVGGVSVVVVDVAGRVVVSVGLLVLRAVSGSVVGVGGSLFGVEWVPVGRSGSGSGSGVGGGWVVVEPGWGSGSGLCGGGVFGGVGEISGVPGVVVLPCVGVSGGVSGVVGGVLAVVREWLGDVRWAGSRLVVVTSGAVGVDGADLGADGGDVGVDVGGAGVWGLVRSAVAEHPGRFGLVDVDVVSDGVVGLGVAAMVGAGAVGGVGECVVRGGEVLVPRLVRRAVDPVVDSAGPVGAELEVGSGAGSGGVWGSGWVLVSGGLSGVGAVVARHVAGSGVAGVVLLGRRGWATPGVVGLVGELEGLGVGVVVVAGDVADRGVVAGIVAGFGLSGVVHAAGVLGDGLVGSLSEDQVSVVVRPKVEGVLVLDELTRGVDLVAFVVFSSLAGTVGNAGQGGYGAANVGVEAVVRGRRGVGLPGVAIAWGLWDVDSDMGAHLDDAQRARLLRRGIEPLSVEQGLAALDAALAMDEPMVVAARLNWPALRAMADDGVLSPLFSSLVRPRNTSTKQDSSGGFADRLVGLSVGEQVSVVVGVVCGVAGEVLGFGDGGVGVDRSFRDVGFDSLTGVEFRNRLSRVVGAGLPATVVFDYPTPLLLAEFVRGLVVGEGGVRESAPVVVVSGDDPIAIVSLGCRFPGGVSSPEEFWQLLTDGADAMSTFPDDRGWNLDALYDADPEHAGTSYVREGGFLSDVTGFDAGFFGVSPREALAMDPQQRLLLEVAWETLERAGIAPESLRGSNTGVFVGLMYHDYASNIPLEALGASEELGGYLATGTSGGVASGRLSYTFGFEGPAVTLDTACSSSLVAMHLACQSLRSGESSLAIAGGVTVMATPGAFVDFSRQGVLSPTGRTSSFAGAADGAVWSEGVGLVLLERLSDARAAGHRVLGLVAGSAVNQDGASNGLTAPNGPSQQRVIRAALASAGLGSSDVDVVEGHGTGTRLGDPIEAQALLATYGQGRERPLWLGSVKSNIGHAQAAAGVAGVIKMVLAMERGVVPRTLHVDVASPEVDWSAGAVALLTEEQRWPETGRARRAGVSSFGISGTNAHVIIEQAPETEGTSDAGGEIGLVPWVFSARSAPGLRAVAERLGSWAPGHPVADVAWSLVPARSGMEHRAVVLGSDEDEMVAGLTALAAGHSTAGVVQGVARTGGKTAFVFPGQGSQRLGMGRGLHQAFPVFAQAFDELVAAADELLDGSLREVMWGEDAELLERTGWAQPALFVVGVAAFRLLESWGVHPDFLAGHSIGELAAAHVAGVLSLPDAIRLVVGRARLMEALPEGGGMATVEAGRDEVTPALTDGVWLAAVNGASSVVLSGHRAALDDMVDDWAARGRRARRLRVSHAFHSPLMEPMLAEFESIARGMTFGAPRIDVVSTVTGRRIGADDWADPEYWVRQVREPVLFGDAVQSLLDTGVSRFLELGPGSALSSLVVAQVEYQRDQGAERHVDVYSAFGTGDEPRALLTGLAGLHCGGLLVDWTRIIPRASTTVSDLPTYPFQHQRYWLSAAAPVQRSLVTELDVGTDETPVRDLSGLPVAQRRQVLLETVRSHAAVALGHDSAADVDPARPFIELGLDSMTGLNLRARLNAALGIRMAQNAVFQHNTPLALVDHLTTLLDTTEPAPVPAQPSGVEQLYRQAMALGRNDLAMDLLGVASQLRPTFTAATDEVTIPEPVHLVPRTARPTLVCFPSFVATVGQFHYARLAKWFQDEYGVTTLLNPGYGPDEPVPADLDALVDAHLRAIATHLDGDQRIVLLGHSAGGLIAHAVATGLDRAGRRPDGLVLLDPPWPGEVGDGELAALAREFLVRQEGEPQDGSFSAWLTTLGAYLRAIDGWTPQPHTVRTLVLRATGELPSGADPTGADLRLHADWRLPHDLIDVPGDHFSLVEAHAETTAQAVRAWLAHLA